MEIANLKLHLRQAARSDLRAISYLLSTAPFNHIHVDWRLPVDWLGTPAFLVAETTSDHRLGHGKLRGCFALGADPPPAAWVRVAAIQEQVSGRQLLQAMLEAALSEIRPLGVSEIGWLPREGWPASWLHGAGFEQIDVVETYVKNDLAPPEGAGNTDVKIREVRDHELVRLAEIEAEAFEPLWRHSVAGLEIGKRYALSFQVAELNGQVVGFQYSTSGDTRKSAHLVRLTVAPSYQRAGIGSALLNAAFESYRCHHLRQVSLNTQRNNEASRRLYEKFGFKQVSANWPVWSLKL